MASKERLLLVKNVYKSFKKNSVLQNVNLSVFENENLAILGENGAGKTTLLNIILGMHKADKGDIIWTDKFKNKIPQSIGVQFQTATYPVGFEVKDIVIFFRKIYNIDKNLSANKKLFNFFEIKKIWSKPIKTLSGGEVKRLNIYFALFHKPKLVFLDEFSSALDHEKKEQYIKFIKKFCEDNSITIVLISHDIEEIMALTEKIIILRKGKLLKKMNLPQGEKGIAMIKSFK